MPPTFSSIAGKLLWLAALNACAFVLIAVLVGVAFHRIGILSSEIAVHQVAAVVENATTGRALFSAFSDMDLVSRSCRGDSVVEEIGPRLSGTMAGFAQRATDPDLADAIAGLAAATTRLLDDCMTINRTMAGIRQVDAALLGELTGLENVVGRALVDETLAGKATDYLDQIMSIITGIRETVLEMGRRIAGWEDDLSSRVQGDHSVAALGDDLTLRLQTLTASPPRMAEMARRLIALAASYKARAMELADATARLRRALELSHAAKDRVLEQMNRLDRDAASRSERVGSEIGVTIGAAGLRVLGFSIAVALLSSLAIVWIIRRSIQRPLGQVIERIHAIRDGTFVPSATPPRKDEWGIIASALSDMSQQVTESRNLLQRIIDTAPTRVFWKDRDLRYLGCNPAFARDAGKTHPSEIIGKNDYQMGWAAQAELYRADDRAVMASGIPKLSYDEQQTTPSGQTLWIRTSKVALRDRDDAVFGLLGIYEDVTLIKEQERALQHIAHYDALTGLPNRVLLAARLRQGMIQARRYGRLLAVAFLDLDGFKAVNDQYGHAAGDQLLIAAAAGMQQALREGDTLARIGGDEFVAVLLDLADLQASAPMLVRLLGAAARGVTVGGQVVQVSASAGVTFYPQADDIDPEQLLRQADQAMYQAKLAGKNRYHVFDAAVDRSVRRYHESLERIRGALAAREFVLYYQPKVNMRTGTVLGVEALIRWQHPDSGLLLPAAFLPAIEDHRLAVEVGEWVIETALSQMEQWQTAGLDLPVSVNVSARQLQQAGFVERLRVLLAVHPHVSPGHLELEVLETSALGDLARVSQVIDACRGIGVLCALDDFGTGYASLTYMKRLPVTQIKIDQTFVRDMLHDPDDLAILDGVIRLCVAFRRQVIAEGVETLEQGEMLLQLGCELAQGYGIASPMPAADIPRWVAIWRPDPLWANAAAVSRDAVPLLFAGAALRAWIAAVEGYLMGERDAPPPLDDQQCAFGLWLDTDGRSRQGARPAFQAIDALHQRVHALAVALCDLRAQCRNSQALAGLAELRGLRDAVLEQLKTRELTK
ncbi:EAL domain-containing protein [uncultured Thiodictyon sp.]|uniref:EAL domain-containing protein n=1 Tax=uncultured Thiodictyon sp. TaxID=1846217 RepID=UPI0025FC3BFD|nr:EAL domain-containing protein [uncultured Thiodictyon sp.]